MISKTDRSNINKIPPPPSLLTNGDLTTVPSIRYFTEVTKKDTNLYDQSDKIIEFANNIQVGSGLEDDGKYIQEIAANYINVATSIHNATIIIDTALRAVQNELDSAENGAGLNEDGTYNQEITSNYIDIATSIHNATVIIDTTLKTLQDELDVSQNGAGLNTDGTYNQPTTSNYLNASTSLANADLELDAQIRINADNIASNLNKIDTNTTNIQSNTDKFASGLTQDVAYMKDATTSGTLTFTNGLLTAVN